MDCNINEQHCSYPLGDIIFYILYTIQVKMVIYIDRMVFQCSYCGYNSSFDFSVNALQMTHTEVKPFQYRAKNKNFILRNNNTIYYNAYYNFLLSLQIEKEPLGRLQDKIKALYSAIKRLNYLYHDGP